MMKADTSPVPVQMPAYRKSRQVICLQLIKRWRNVFYGRKYKGLRLPPSVLLTYYIGLHTNITRSLTDELIHHVECIETKILGAQGSASGLLDESNPACEKDVLTGRWPGDKRSQLLFLQELREFSADLKRLKAGLPLQEMRKVLEKLFGEKPAGDAIEAYKVRFVEDNAGGKLQYIPGTGAVPALGALIAPASARPVPKSTPFGD